MMDKRLQGARNISGGPRFYPAGQHPAAYRQRWFLAKLYEAGMGRSDAANYAQGMIDAIERGELKAKAYYLAQVSQ